jgi:hypothetical protein
MAGETGKAVDKLTEFHWNYTCHFTFLEYTSIKLNISV